MDLHVYRNSQDRWYDLREAATARGAVLAVNAVTLTELVERITPDVKVATTGQRVALLTLDEIGGAEDTGGFPNFARYAYDAIFQLKASRVRPHELRAAGAALLAETLDRYDRAVYKAGLCDPQDRFVLAASRVKEGSIAW